MNQTKWYDRVGEQGDLVVSTRIRLARNLQDYVFSSRLTPEGILEVSALVRDSLTDAAQTAGVSLGYYAPDTLSVDARRSLAERHIISREFAESSQNRGLMLSDDESVSLLLCHHDHVRLQVMQAGLSLQDAYAMADRLDDMIDQNTAYAFDKKLGYLTESPTDLGTGMKASVLLHLPALEATGEVQTLSKAVSKIGLSLRGTYGDGSVVSGSLYELSNRITMGIDESSALQNLQAVTEQIIAREHQEREELSHLQIEDAAYRALGLLQNARILSLREFTDSLSRLRMGVSMGLLEGVSIPVLNRMNIEMCPATLLLSHPEADSTEKRDVIRATKVREELKQGG